MLTYTNVNEWIDIGAYMHQIVYSTVNEDYLVSDDNVQTYLPVLPDRERVEEYPR